MHSLRSRTRRARSARSRIGERRLLAGMQGQRARQAAHRPAARMQVVHADALAEAAGAAQSQQHVALRSQGQDRRQVALDDRCRALAQLPGIEHRQYRDGNRGDGPALARKLPERHRDARDSEQHERPDQGRRRPHRRGASTFASRASSTWSTRWPSICSSGASAMRWRSAGLGDLAHVVGRDEVAAVRAPPAHAPRAPARCCRAGRRRATMPGHLRVARGDAHGVVEHLPRPRSPRRCRAAWR